MFSIKQFVINLSSEARQELRNLIDEIEGNAPVETPANPVVEQDQLDSAEENQASDASAPVETPAEE